MGRHLEHLFNDSKEYLATLQGRELDTQLEGNPMLLSPSSALPFLKNLHIVLSKTYPETGMPYWRIRAWELSCWQPIYLALICVYHIKHVPSSLHNLHQHQQGDYIAGYALADEEWFTGEHIKLLQYASQQLDELFGTIQAVHIQVFGGKKALYQAVLADLIFGTMLNTGQAFTSIEAIKSEYQIWANALNLPTNITNRFIMDTDEPMYIRQTCCLHFRRDAGKFCDNCPRTHTLQFKNNQLRDDQFREKHV